MSKTKAKPARKRTRVDALVLEIEEDSYADVLRAMRGENRLSEFGADVKSIRRTRTGKVMLVLKKDAINKGSSHTALAQEGMGKKVQVRALLDEITNTEELSAILKQ